MRKLTAMMFLFAVIAWTASVHAQTKDKPNVVLIMTDDQGYGDLSVTGNPVLKTPEIDKLASKSIRLEDYHASPYCVPSRAALMTGRYADRTGVHNRLNPNWFVRSDEVMLSNMFKDAGYATGMFGKWHLGDNYPYRPIDRGFDEVLRHFGGAIGVVNDYWGNKYINDTYYQNGKPVKTKGYCTDVFFDAATRFIEKCAKQKKPFLVYLPTNAPHGPLIPPPGSDVKAYSEALRKTQNLGDSKTKERILGEGRKRGQGSSATSRAVGRVSKFYSMIANIDENVGQLRAFLEENGLAENTIFIFTTDNGSAFGTDVFNAGMRGKKADAYDGGHRVPFFLHWPAAGLDRERRVETLASHTDITPTLLDLCGIPQPAGVEFDGVSLRSLMEKGDHAEWPDRIIMTDAQQFDVPKKWEQTAIMTERWRLVNGKELYDIDADPGQKRNVRAKYPKVFERLNKYYDELWEELQPSFQKVAEIPLVAPREETVTLNYHDCILRNMFWMQNSVMSLQGSYQGKKGPLVDSAQRARTRDLAYWPVSVAEEGAYRFEARRWPIELDREITAGHQGGVAFPAVKAEFRIGDYHQTVRVDADMKAVSVRAPLAAGSHRLSARFFDAQGRSLDAFYVYVSKVK